MLRFLRETFENGRLAAQALFANRLRTALAIAGIGVGVATLIAIFGIIQGLNQSFSSQLDALGSSSLTVSRRPWILGPNNWWKFRRRPPVTVRDYLEVKGQSVLASGVAPTIDDSFDMKFADRSISSVQTVGTTEDFSVARGRYPRLGRFLSVSDDQLRQRVVVLGEDVVRALFGAGEDAIGRWVLLSRAPYQVIGVLERKGSLLGQSLDLVALVPFDTFRNDFGAKRSINIAVASADPQALDAVEDEVTTILRRVRGLRPQEEDSFSVNRQEQFTKLYNQLTGTLYAVAFGVGLITLVVGGIGIMNIMLVSVRERTREIGVRRAVGARRRAIVMQFLFESVAVSLAGGAVGTVGGLTVAHFVGELTPLAAAVTPSGVVLGLGFSSVVGMLFGIWPAWTAAQLDPVEALRYE
jgi:putative ABC transport system permease protein